MTHESNEATERAEWWQTLTPAQRLRALEAAGERATVNDAFMLARIAALSSIAAAIANAGRGLKGDEENEIAIVET